ncbi:fatty acid-binding protein, liver-type-like [Rhynchophorus ferrugineus]|uniref:Fatty acid-binding protein n=1 Tax=Rhynchophorus ferrugineus TaxID=354439 RepID=A0A834I7I0_RHYFE|nr:hypothetical protein GWI33_011146 [Rhynchophorus ferrugineus]
MVQIEGTYEPVSEENYTEYLKAFNVPDELISKILKSKTPVVISDVTDTSITIAIKDKGTTFTFGEEKAYSLPTEHKVKSTLKRDGNIITFHTSLQDNEAVFEDKVYEFTDDGLVSTGTNYKGVKGVFKYKRL